jgi:hypothetical protein
MINTLIHTAHSVAANAQVPQGTPGVIDATHHVLVATPHLMAAATTPAVSTGGVGAGAGAIVLLGLYVWYEFKHKGWDWLPFLTGGAFFSILAGTSTGGPIVHGIGGAVAAIFNGIFSAFGSAI